MKFRSNNTTRFLTTFFFVIVFFPFNGFAQQKTNELALINEQVWSKFYEAFATYNYGLMEEIHHKDLIRISGDGKSISNKETYINRQKQSFENAKEKGERRTIELRFFERFYNETTASERGVYQLTINKGLEDERNFYGQFHVLQKKVLGVWKIFMDYDSSENETVDKAEFDTAKHILELDDY